MAQANLSTMAEPKAEPEKSQLQSKRPYTDLSSQANNQTMSKPEQEDSSCSKKRCTLSDVKQRWGEKVKELKEWCPMLSKFECSSSGTAAEQPLLGSPSASTVSFATASGNEKLVPSQGGLITTEVQPLNYGTNQMGQAGRGLGIAAHLGFQQQQRPGSLFQPLPSNRPLVMLNRQASGQGEAMLNGHPLNGFQSPGGMSPSGMQQQQNGMGGLQTTPSNVNGMMQPAVGMGGVNGMNGGMRPVNGLNGFNSPNGICNMNNMGGANCLNRNGNGAGLANVQEMKPTMRNGSVQPNGCPQFSQLSLGRSPSGTPAPMPRPRHISITPGPPVPMLKTEKSTGSNSSMEGTNEKRKRVIDLTGDDDDDVVIVSERVNSNPIARPAHRPIYVPSPTPGPSGNPGFGDKTICVGMLTECFINAHTVPAPRQGMDIFGQTWPLTPIGLCRPPGAPASCFTFKAIDYSRKEFGVLDLKTARALLKLADHKIIRLQPRLIPRAKRPGEKVGDLIPDEYKQLRLYINIYTADPNFQLVGDEMRKYGMRLLPPKMADEGIPYKNPLADDLLAVQAVQSHEQFESALNNVMLDLSGKLESLPEMEQDPRVITPLLRHQKQGLYFMTEHEKPVRYNFTENSTPWRAVFDKRGNLEKYVHVETGLDQCEQPLPVTGGILADVMGLGKTLSILSLIASTLDDARKFTGFELDTTNQNALQPVFTTGATLLVTPMSTITNWEEQIKCHLQEGSVSYYIYHGARRELDYRTLSKYDIIITTYSILGGEVHKARKDFNNDENNYVCRTPLLQLEFFRVVLDEAHTIREQRTQQFEGAYYVKANRRWAVTGTPVQNGLKDLQALIRFLHISPFATTKNFSSYILAPFKNADPCGLARIRKLVDSITLRRGKDKIDLPPRHDKIVYLDFSSEERELYDKIFQQSKTAVEITYKATAQKKRVKALGGSHYAHLLQAIMKLRLACTHGKDLLCEADMAGLSQANAIDVDELEENGPSMDPKQAYSVYRLMLDASSNQCAVCTDKPVRVDAEPDKVFGYITGCYHFICLKCLKDYDTAIAQSHKTTGRYSCPLCEVIVAKNAFPLKYNELEASVKADAKSKKRSKYTGPSSKVKALIADLQRDRDENPDAPAKSVVFSTWTSHLELIGEALNSTSFKFVRLDGTMLLKQRQAAITTFREDPSVQVMLISIMAGGLGLNLTCASKAYVMEPLFNPACEAQAIDRVHRLGQKKEVTTVRFIMRDSFEEKILLLQKRKMDLAKMSMGKIDKAELTRQKLGELAEMFTITPFP